MQEKPGKLSRRGEIEMKKSARKFKIANRISFACFGAYYLSFILLTILAGRAVYLTALIIPTLALIALLINVLVKYRHLGIKPVGKAARITAVLSIFMNGLSFAEKSRALKAGFSDWDRKTQEILRYPSIVPAWLFVFAFL